MQVAAWRPLLLLLLACQTCAQPLADESSDLLLMRRRALAMARKAQLAAAEAAAEDEAMDATREAEAAEMAALSRLRVPVLPVRNAASSKAQRVSAQPFARCGSSSHQRRTRREAAGRAKKEGARQPSQRHWAPDLSSSA